MALKAAKNKQKRLNKLGDLDSEETFQLLMAFFIKLNSGLSTKVQYIMV